MRTAAVAITALLVAALPRPALGDPANSGKSPQTNTATPAHTGPQARDLGGNQQDQCPLSLFFRTPLQVWQSHVAAIAAGNLQAIGCDYATDATVIMAGNVINGRTTIVDSLIAFQLSLGALPTVTSVTSSGPVVYIEYTLQTPHLLIPDGADTYVIVAGHIQYQTVHATFEPQ